MSHEGKNNFRQGIASTKKQLEARRAQLEETSARIEKRAGRNLFLAIATGLLLAAAFLLSLFLYKPLFVLFVCALVFVASLELATALRSKRRVSRIAIALASAAILISAYFGDATTVLITLLGAFVFLTLWRIVEIPFLRASKEAAPYQFIKDAVAGLFVLTYIAFLGSVAILIVKLENGTLWIFTLVVVVVLIDIGAYAAGITLGKHKMTPVISPNKTWEGFLGGLVAGTIAAVVCGIYLLHIPWWVGVLMGLLMLLTATVGDLTESLIKRNLGIKDMSNWIPGHGGLLDRLDSLLPSTIPIYATALLVEVLNV